MSKLLINHIFPFVLNLYLKTIRLKIINKSTVRGVYIFWHSNMLAGWKTFKKRNYNALVSKSKDGEILTKLLTKLNYNVIRGSSSRDGKNAIEEILKNSELNSIALTPDGPRGPANNIKNGAFILANKLAIPIIPLKIEYNNFITLKKSWDQFKIPIPFSSCKVIFGNEFYYPEYLNNIELENLKKIISIEM